MDKISRGIYHFCNASILGSAAAVGKTEGEGPLGARFDKVADDDTMGKESWEQAESAFFESAVDLCIGKCCVSADDIDVVFAGDLLNQCVASSFGLRDRKIPQIGMYDACATMASTLLNAAVFAECGASQCLAVVSSHFSSSERQFRTPLEYGGQRAPTAQRTVTGAGAAIIGSGGAVHITRGCAGIIEDLGITDPANMGAAMAPAAASTIARFLNDTQASPDEYDMILTGDLGTIGSELLLELLMRDHIDISRVHRDCGVMIYDIEKQDAHAGGSGCGCSAAVLCGSILPAMESGEVVKVLFVGTGALLSATSALQGESIPGIAHAVELCGK